VTAQHWGLPELGAPGSDSGGWQPALRRQLGLPSSPESLAVESIGGPEDRQSGPRGDNPRRDP